MSTAEEKEETPRSQQSELLWPRTLDTAQRFVVQGTVGAAVATVLALIPMLGAGAGALQLIGPAVVFTGLVAGVYVRSRFAATLFVLFQLASIIVEGFKPADLVLLLLLRGAVGTYAWHRLGGAADDGYRSARLLIVGLIGPLAAFIVIAVGVYYAFTATGDDGGLPSMLVPQEPLPLLEARAGHRTKLRDDAISFNEAALDPAPEGFELVRYAAPPGPLAAYITPDPGDGKQHPAVLWAKGGFGGIGAWLGQRMPADNDQSVRGFLERGIVVMTPSWRGEAQNPGRFELFYGEVDDYLAARDFLAARSYVDPDRIYLAGHSTGGTLVLLAAGASDRFRAAFSIGGRADLSWLYRQSPEGYGNTPYDTSNPREHALRSAARFTRHIKRPTFFFEGGDAPDAALMGQLARSFEVPFWAHIFKGATHFSLNAPLQRFLAKKILADDLAQPFSLTPAEIQAFAEGL